MSLAEEGSILVFTIPRGQFKNYDNSSNTIIHEIVHIEIEESIISKFEAPHALKERVVRKKSAYSKRNDKFGFTKIKTHPTLGIC